MTLLRLNPIIYNMKRLLATTLLTAGLVFAGITHDKSLSHGHGSPENYDKKHLEAKRAGGTPLTVHIVPHTHDDVGWLKTPDQYFSGSRYVI